MFFQKKNKKLWISTFYQPTKPRYNQTHSKNWITAPKHQQLLTKNSYHYQPYTILLQKRVPSATRLSLTQPIQHQLLTIKPLQTKVDGKREGYWSTKILALMGLSKKHDVRVRELQPWHEFARAERVTVHLKHTKASLWNWVVIRGFGRFVRDSICGTYHVNQIFKFTR
jgi:hypothetical protein